MKKPFLILTVVLGLTVAHSYKKGDTGGHALISVNVQRDIYTVKAPTVYVKFDADEMPSDPTNNYDLKEIGVSTSSYVWIDKLRYGKYYIYATGFDSSIMKPVQGGFPIKIK